MRYLIKKKYSTKPERIVYEVLKEMKIPFKHRWLIRGKEVDYLIFEKIIIEIDGHEQDTRKNEFLANLGYIPIHFKNNEIKRETIINLIKNYVN